MALLNNDVSGLEEYKMKRRMLETQKHEINNVKSEIDSIKNDMAEIKQLMIKLLEGTNG
jgi:chaperonin cofactor prefoldin